MGVAAGQTAGRVHRPDRGSASGLAVTAGRVRSGQLQQALPALALGLVLAAAGGSRAIAETAAAPTIRTMIETFRQGPGCGKAALAVGVNSGGDQSVFTSGSVVLPGGRPEPVTATTPFQVGSVAKTVTATIYAQLLAEGLLKADDPLRQHLPPGTPLPSFKDPDSGETVEITLDHLARHTSGLPRQQATATYPFTDERMLGSLDRIVLKTRPGTKYVYSHLGVALLAKAMEHATGKSLTELVENRFSRPLGLTGTHFYRDPEPQLAVGFDRADLPAERVASTWPAYDGSGALVSTLADMMTMLAANMDRGSADNGVAPVLARLQDWKTVPCASTQEGGQGCASMETGLGWSRLESKVPGLSTVWKNGMTKGFAAWIGFVAPVPGEQSPSGVVVRASQTSWPVGPLASCVLAVVNGRPPAAICLPQAKVGQ